jgi:hypothetical protein
MTKLQKAIAKRKKERPILGSFGKALPDAVSINFGLSGGRNCDVRCKHHPDSTAKDATKQCYAVRIEIRPDRIQLKGKLERHENMPPALVCNRATLEIITAVERGIVIPWARISTAGSLPQPEDVREDKAFRDAFRRLLETCRQYGIPVHIPVETYEKARFYRALAGDLVVIRESAQSDRRFLRAKGAVSVVGGTPEMSRLERVEKSRELAAKRRELTGRKTVVCPAITNSFAARRDPSKKNDRAKCGACVACSLAHIDIVYPLH